MPECPVSTRYEPRAHRLAIRNGRRNTLIERSDRGLPKIYLRRRESIAIPASASAPRLAGSGTDAWMLVKAALMKSAPFAGPHCPYTPTVKLVGPPSRFDQASGPV